MKKYRTFAIAMALVLIGCLISGCGPTKPQIIKNDSFVVTKEEFVAAYQKTLASNLEGNPTVEIKEDDSFYEIYVNGTNKNIQLGFGDASDPIQEGKVLGNKVMINLLNMSGETEFFQEACACMITMLSPSANYKNSLETAKDIIKNKNSQVMGNISCSYYYLATTGSSGGLGIFNIKIVKNEDGSAAETSTQKPASTPTSTVTKSAVITLIKTAVTSADTSLNITVKEYKDGVACIMSTSEGMDSSIIKKISSSSETIKRSVRSEMRSISDSMREMCDAYKKTVEEYFEQSIDFPIYMCFVASDDENVEMIVIKDGYEIYNFLDE